MTAILTIAALGLLISAALLYHRYHSIVEADRERWEIRRALEDHVERQAQTSEAVA